MLLLTTAVLRAAEYLLLTDSRSSGRDSIQNWPRDPRNPNYNELKIAENFNEFIGENVEDEGLAFDDTSQLVDDYIESVDTDLDKDRIKVQMRELMTEAQALEIA